MKGWVYVITNKSMPGLVKVGFSLKDPELRAKELNNTGAPHPYDVNYELLIENPYQIEQKSHKALLHKLEAKEWFRCSPEEAILVIKNIAGSSIITEIFKKTVKEIKK
jgi:T5orf172 domain